MSFDFLLLAFLFFGIAAVYSAAGFGGGSSYLAILSLMLVDFEQIRTLALVCNLVVVSGSVWLFYKAGQWTAASIFPLVVLSVPFAFIGASLSLSPQRFFAILGVTLVIAAALMTLRNSSVGEPSRHHPAIQCFLGGVIGFVSGLVGIGGGIFLSPTLHLIRWDHAKRIAAASSVFILVNSIAGIAGLVSSGQFEMGQPATLALPIAVLVGGQMGVRYCLSQTATTRIRRLTALLVLVAGLRILWKSVLF